MEDDYVVFDSVFFELEGVGSGSAEVEEGEDVERDGETHLKLHVAFGQSDEDWEEDDSEVEHVGAEEGQETVFVDASEREDVFVVDLRVVHVSQVYLLLFGEEDVGGDQLVSFVVFQDELCCFFDVFGHLGVFAVEADDPIGHHDGNDHEYEDEEMS